MKIIFEDENIVVCIKPVGIDSEHQMIDALKQTLDGEFFVVHRLDKAVGGVMVFARNKQSAATLSRVIQNGEMIKEYVDYLSIGISNIINIFEPEAICIGGSFSEYSNIFFEPLKETLLQGNLLFNKRNEIIIKYAKLKNDAGIIGAALIG